MSKTVAKRLARPKAPVKPRAPGESKYGNRRMELDGRWFDSKGELMRYCDLRILERTGEIEELQTQVPFELAPAVKINGRVRPPLRYIADFTYKKNGVLVVEDFKGHRTQEYVIKRHLMKSVHGIDIKETERGRA